MLTTDPTRSASMLSRDAWAALRADLRANRGHPKETLIVASLRLSQLVRRVPVLGTVAVLGHRFLTEIVFGIELRTETVVGPGLKLFHCYATVINTDVVLGRNAKLHQSVTIGARHTGERSPVIGDDVSIGAGAIIIGAIHVGDGASVGAGAVVVKDVPAGATVVGNPARVVGTAQ